MWVMNFKFVSHGGMVFILIGRPVIQHFCIPVCTHSFDGLKALLLKKCFSDENETKE